MAVHPGAIWRPLPENATQGPCRPRLVILHSAVSRGAQSLWPYFARRDVSVESHFYVRKNGTFEQMIDTAVRADANRYANSYAISVETEDNGSPDRDPWSPEQLFTLAAICDWANRVHGVPRRQADGPSGSGIGWHSQWGAPSAWTPARGKTCPGAARIAQIPGIIARVQAMAAPIPASTIPPANVPNPLAELGAWAASQPVLKPGDRNLAVAQVQGWLNDLCRAGLTVDGSFGPATSRWVKQYQTDRGLVADGIVGPATWAHMFLERLAAR